MDNKLGLRGHLIDEYRGMFDLSELDMNGRLLEYGCGPSVINAELQGFRHQVIRCDPLFNFPLPFADFSFDLVLSAHYLFSTSNDQDAELHLRVLRELARVGKEVRVYPLEVLGQISPMLGPVLLGLQHDNFGVEVRQVDYPSQSGGNAMLRVSAQQCQVS